MSKKHKHILPLNFVFGNDKYNNINSVIGIMMRTSRVTATRTTTEARMKGREGKMKGRERKGSEVK